ncbi:MAG: RagB/SusD family nutrient uptake outer membrane protein, partial [Odoribacter sp.]|nr:RagB/SusD family nutrient uptake outer membrane protein [Odoribacter sp.]
GKANNNIFYYSANMFKPTEELLNLCHREGQGMDYRRYIFESFADLTTGDGIQEGPTDYHMFATQEKNCYYIGLKISEAYVIRAEAYARQGNSKEAVNDLNRLLINRIKADQFIPLQESDFTQQTLLKRVLEERRVELAFDGGLRWFDLRRLGKPALTHVYENGLVYNLKQGDLRYVLQIPESEQINSPNIELNPRD